MMKSDERELLRAIRAGSAEPASLSPARHQLLMRRFKRHGLVRDGKVTPRGTRMLTRLDKAEAKNAAQLKEPERPSEPIEEERQSENVSDIQRPVWEGMDSST